VIELLQTDVPSGVAAAALAVTLLLAAPLAALLVWQTVRRRRAEREAHTVRAELDAITANMREAVIAYDLDLRLIYINPAFERLTGYSADDVRDGEFLQYIHPDDRTAILAEWEHLAAGGVLREQEYRLLTRGGQIRWSSAAWQPIRDRTGRQIGLLGTEFDITERKLAETERLQDTELFQAVLDVQQAVAAAGLDSRMVMHAIAERTQRLTGAGGVVIETAGGTLTPSLHLGDTDAPASVIAVELKDEQRTLGTLKILSSQPNAFTPRDAKAIRLLGGLVGAALGHASAYEARQSRLEERTEALQESEQRFKQLVDAAQEGICLADERGTITYANVRLAEMLGQHGGALLGRHVADFVDPGSRPGALRLFAEGAKAPTERRDFRFCRQDGSVLWALVSASPLADRDGRPVGTVGLLTDITERKRAEERLRRSAERLTTLHDLDQAILAAGSPADVGRAALVRIRRMVPCQYCTVVLFDADGEGGRLVAGYAGTAPLGADAVPLELLQPTRGGHHDTVQHVDDLRSLDGASPLLQRLHEEGLRCVLALPLLVDGRPIGAVTLASPVPGAFNADHREVAIEVAAPLAIAIQHARLREEMARQTTDLERRLADRSAALRSAGAELETVLHALAHDLRPPLRHIDGFVQLLLEESRPSGSAALQHYAERVREGAGRMAALVEDLLRLSRIGRQDIMRRPVDLGALVEEIAGQWQCRAEGRSIDWQLEPLPTVDADPLLARLAVTELLSNAVKFTAPRDHAVIRVRPVQRDGQPGLAVQDNGVGFRMAHAGKLFGIFQRLHRAEEFAGTGAGLALVQRIAHRHGGHAWAEAEEDIGATFHLTFGPRAVLT
jgi:PAS domain S-box-containing protein